MSELQSSVFIGRDPNTSRLGVFKSPTSLTLLDEIADNCVSRYKPKEQTAHCRLEFYTDGQLKLINLNPQNVTYVNGQPIEKAWIDDDSIIELGYNRYCLPFKQLLKKIKWSKPYSINHLQGIYQDYQDELTELQLKLQKESNKQRLQGIFTQLGMLVWFLPESLVGSMALPIKIICTVITLAIGIYFYVRSMNPQNTFVMRKKDVDTKLKDRYRCPNPECDRPFPVTLSYESLEMQRKCPFCGCKYVVKKSDMYVNHGYPQPYIQQNGYNLAYH